MSSEPDGSEPVTAPDAAESDAAAAVEDDLSRLLGERDEMRALAQQIQADFENYRKQAMRRETSVRRAGERESAGEAAAGPRQLRCGDGSDRRRNGRRASARAWSSCSPNFVGVLEGAGLERIETDGQPFDPTEHEAVLHEDGDGEAIVAATMRSGYRLKGRVLRPAMVKVTK